MHSSPAAAVRLIQEWLWLQTERPGHLYGAGGAGEHKRALSVRRVEDQSVVMLRRSPDLNIIRLELNY